MGVYIKGMEMPTDCIFCPLFHGAWTMCTVLNKTTHIKGRPDDCPLFPVHDHGRLIDEKELLSGCGYIIADGMACIPVKHITNAPTIIPAEEGE